MIAEFLLTVLYAQVIVFRPDAPTYGLFWTEAHVAQGFAWSDGFVSFGLPDHDGEVRLEVVLAETFRPDPATLWAVQTPFTVGLQPLSVGTIGIEQAVSLPAGTYNLVFEARAAGVEEQADLAYVLRLHFVPDAAPDFAILVQGGDLTTAKVLERTAAPATP